MLASPEVVILGPCTGTGNFIISLIERMPGSALGEAYNHRLFANEVMHHRVAIQMKNNVEKVIVIPLGVETKMILLRMQE